MNRNQLIWVAFIALVLIQWYVPASMIWQNESVIAKGALYKFEVAPVDPYDPFRGRYINLSVKNNTIEMDSTTSWKVKDEVFVYLKRDAQEFAVIDFVSKQSGLQGDYILASVRSVTTAGATTELGIDFPFDRYYMEEEKAPIADSLYAHAFEDSLNTVYALVHVYEGKAVLNNVMINDQPLSEMIKERKPQ